MVAAQIELLGEPERVRLALSPIRRRLLERLREPGSATQLAGELEMGRQRVNYHLRTLERAGLVELVEERRRRGCVERILVATANAFVVDPSLMAAEPDAAAAQDRFAAEHLLETAAGVVRDVARMQGAAQREGSRLLTFTVETEVHLATPADVEPFTSRLAELVGLAAAEFGAAGEGRRYRVIAGGHPAPEQPNGRSET